MLRVDSWDSKAWAGQPEKTIGMVQAGKEREDSVSDYVKPMS